MATLLEPEEHVLSTLNKDGSRNWLRPKLSPGRFLLRRRIVAYILIALFTIIPYTKINDKPTILLDIAHREFTIFGFTFLPTDTLLLALFMLCLFVSIFLITALLGRIWCGWACPQTVYMEFLFRPLERLIEGAPGRARKTSGLRRTIKYIVYFICAVYLAHTFLAYFVGIETLFQWVQTSPLEHPTAFIVMAAVTGLMLFDFGFFREQVCIVMCPYGRFQSVMLDRNSLIVTYDQERGEPRGKMKRKKKPTGDVALDVLQEETPAVGDCVDCKKCVTTCPTGIDIRNGLQMECIGCAQCIDACDAVMKKLGRKIGLIRYSSQAAVEDGHWSLLRPRVFLYPTFLAILITAFIFVFAGKNSADVVLLRGKGRPFMMMEGGMVSNQMRVKITNRSGVVASYTLADNLADCELVVPEGNPVTIDPGATKTIDVLIVSPGHIFSEGSVPIKIGVTSAALNVEHTYRLVGPDESRAVEKTGDTP